MSGPITRPIRDDRPRGLDGRLLDYTATDERGSDGERYSHQYQKSREPAQERPQQSKVRAALLAMVPDRFRPAASLLWGCWVCLWLTALSLIGSVEWHYVPLWQPRTAAADELAKNKARVESLEGDLAEVLRMQQLAEINELRCYVEIMENVSPVVVNRLNEVLEKYRSRNNRYPPSFPCRKEATK